MIDTTYVAFRGQLGERHKEEEARALIRSAIRDIERGLHSATEGRPPWLVVAYAFKGGTTYGAYHSPSNRSFIAHAPEELVEQMREAFPSVLATGKDASSTAVRRQA